MLKPSGRRERERLTTVVYGGTFSLYDRQALDEFLAPLYARLKANRIPTNVFRGRRCLDAGCGGGRGSILMAECGAREVVAVDLSHKNVETCQRHAVARGLQQITIRQHSLMQLPFEDESFDVVWCNGVLHHTEDPDKGLREITRVLKTGGRLWLYLYGSGGIYWYVIDWIRALLAGVRVEDCLRQLHLMQIPVRRIAEWIDDWFVPHLRRYTNSDVRRRLEELGYSATERLRFGVNYDTSQRLTNAAAAAVPFLGEGDLRYFCHKAGGEKSHRFKLPDLAHGMGSAYGESAEVRRFRRPLEKIERSLRELEANLGHEISAYKIMTAAAVHTKVRGLLESRGRFDANPLHEHLADLNGTLKQLASGVDYTGVRKLE